MREERSVALGGKERSLVDPLGPNFYGYWYDPPPPRLPKAPQRLDDSERPIPDFRELEDRLCERMDLQKELHKLPFELLVIADRLLQGYSQHEIAAHLGLGSRQLAMLLRELSFHLDRDRGLH